MKKRTRKQRNQSPQPKKSLRELLISAGGVEDPNLFGEATSGVILSFGWDGSEPEVESPAGDLGDIDNDEWDLRPVNFDPKTGKRLKQGSRAAATATERFDIQEDKHYCIWCGTRIRSHYSSISRWVPCVEVLQRNAAAMARTRSRT